MILNRKKGSVCPRDHIYHPRRFQKVIVFICGTSESGFFIFSLPFCVYFSLTGFRIAKNYGYPFSCCTMSEFCVVNCPFCIPKSNIYGPKLIKNIPDSDVVHGILQIQQLRQVNCSYRRLQTYISTLQIYSNSK